MLAIRCISRYITAMTKTAQISLRFTPDLKDALARAADHEVRSMASLVEKIVIDWLRAHDYVAKDPS
jgi:hypothetical protein